VGQGADRPPETQFRPQYQRCRALLAAGRGDTKEARRWATDTLQRAKAVGARWDELEALRARAMAALLEQAPERAVEDLRMVWECCEREGVLDPGAFPVAPELVEALVEVGELDAAREVTERLGELAEQQDHAWGRANAKRCRALVTLASDQKHEPSAALLPEAVGDFERLELRFDAACCLLGLGRALRRAKRWRSAREALELLVSGQGRAATARVPGTV
jgi:tetratricopeptide (TPR) repeat protein